MGEKGANVLNSNSPCQLMVSQCLGLPGILPAAVTGRGYYGYWRINPYITGQDSSMPTQRRYHPDGTETICPTRCTATLLGSTSSMGFLLVFYANCSPKMKLLWKYTLVIGCVNSSAAGFLVPNVTPLT